MRIGILEGDGYSARALSHLQSIGNVEVYAGQDLACFLSDKEAICIRLKYYCDPDFLDMAPQLKYICSPTTGLNHIDLEYCEKRNIRVISLRGEVSFLKNIRATPEHTFGLILSLLRKYKFSFLNQTNKGWDRDIYRGSELFEKKIGIIGLGRVGALLAKYCVAFDADVWFYDRDETITSDIATRSRALEDLVKCCDIVVLSASYSKENEQFFSRDIIDLLENKFFINTSRGELVDEEYMIQKAGENYFAGLAVDVIQKENTSDMKLREFLAVAEDKNIIITPHISGATYESMWKTEEFIVSKFLRIIEEVDR